MSDRVGEEARSGDSLCVGVRELARHRCLGFSRVYLCVRVSASLLTLLLPIAYAHTIVCVIYICMFRV